MSKIEELVRDNLLTDCGKNIRVYITDDKVKLPSVTSIANFVEKEWLEQWRAKNKHWEEILLYAGTMGTMSHWRFAVDLAMDWGFPPDVLELSAQQKHAVEMWYDEFPFSSKYKGMRDDININYATFLSWKEKYEPKPPFVEKNGRRKQANIIPIEFTTYSKHFGYAGTVDLMCSIYDQKKSDDINIINDYKTNFVVYPSYQLQLSGYQIGVNELHPDIKIDGLYITNISPFEMNYSFTNQVFAKKKWLENVKKFFILNRESVEMKFLAEEVIKNIEDELG